MQRKYYLPLVTALFLITFVIVQAASDPQITIHEQNVDAFPQVQLTFSVPESLDNGIPLLPREMEIWEEGQKNLHPFVLLPPGSPSSGLDLFILIDTSSGAAPFADVIRANLKALARHFQSSNTKVQLHVSVFGDGDLGVDEEPATFNLAAANEFEIFVDSLSFDFGSPNPAHGFNKLYQFAALAPASDSQKVALIINGSPFYDSQTDQNTTYNLPDTIQQLASQNFIVFTSGFPFRQFRGLTTENTEDGSLNHALPGGYLGSFSADITLIPDLLKKRNAEQYILLYHSSKKADHTASAQLFILGKQVGQIDYSSFTSPVPHLLHEPVIAHLGQPADVQLQITAPRTLISLAELFYLKPNGELKRVVMQHLRHQKTTDLWSFQVRIPAEDIESKQIPYYFVVRTPEHQIESDIHTLKVIDYDDGIVLTPSVQQDHIRWELSGPTVDQGVSYQFWMDDTLLTETADRHFSIPLGECDLYQTVKAKVLLRPSADHPRAGEWSLFSLPGEAYAGTEAGVTENEVIELTLTCVEAKIVSSESEFSAIQPSYQPDRLTNLERGLNYLTILMKGELSEELPLYTYPPIYHLMEFITKDAYDQSKNPDSVMQKSVLYKLIGHLRYTEDFLKKFEKALEDYAALIRGEVSI